MGEKRGKEFVERIRSEVLAGDGAMGTLLYERGVPFHVNTESVNLETPGRVAEVHREYIAAGARLIETNTYGANRLKLGKFGLDGRAAEICAAGARIAREAAEACDAVVYVAGAVGPLLPTEVGSTLPKTEAEIRAAFEEQVVALAEEGVDLIALETFSNLEELLIALAVTKEKTGLPVGCQLAFVERGHTYHGAEAKAALVRLEEAGADFVGANCGRGPKAAIDVIREMARTSELPLAAFPNAGFPQFREGRYYYLMTPEYLAESAKDLVAAGANLVGGCCGTTPAEIEVMAQAIAGLSPATREVATAPAEPKKKKAKKEIPSAPHEPHFLDAGHKRPLILCEIDSPKGMRIKKPLEGMQSLIAAGADTITIGDSPLAILRMQNVPVAYKLREATGIDPIIHVSCRDRNLIGMQSYLMGAHLLGVRTILALTGDPARVGNQPSASSVYDLNSFGLLELIGKMNEGLNHAGNSIGLKCDFIPGVAFNPNVRRLDAQVRRLERKVAIGARFAMTQPVFSVEKARQVYEKTEHIEGLEIMIGLFPLTSWRNAEYLHNEVPGIEVPEDVRKRLRPLGDDGLEEGLQVCREIIDDLFDTAPGFYIIAPFNKAPIARTLVEHIRSRTPAKPE